ncbi:spore germination protein [Paenibacillus antri]|uniref:Spore germination protein n=1 Tax=Paenibacillus antri TaxID=2582848 RepID=A0A5R9GNS1_9BACL|nr:spore germination protein [Paenibacillus antri]TLS53785.1 spore germination protein [Paenibacillus antri]
MDPKTSAMLQETTALLANCADLVRRREAESDVEVLYFQSLADPKRLHDVVMTPLAEGAADASSVREQPHYRRVTNAEAAVDALLRGEAVVFVSDSAFSAEIAAPVSRNVQPPEQETVITGPMDGFTESLNTNLGLIRKRVKSRQLKNVSVTVGSLSKTAVNILYIEGLADNRLLNELLRRMNGLDKRAVFDGNMLTQYLSDDIYSVFPPFLTSERPDVIVSKLTEGKIVGLVDGSPHAFSLPSTFLEFFSSAEDYYQRWAVGTALRVLRIIAFAISVSFTAIYVAVTTFHYEMIPQSLLLTLAESRSRVPFPPLYEAMIMEVTIELLREAGARLPTKIGQTIGIVGGIVIGQAAVDAGFTSNILIIAVALSAIASFVIPSYVMSASIRLIRFGMILLAGIWGNLGIAMGVALLVIHLGGLTNLGAPYLAPLAPSSGRDLLKAFFRLPQRPRWSRRGKPSAEGNDSA